MAGSIDWYGHWQRTSNMSPSKQNQQQRGIIVLHPLPLSKQMHAVLQIGKGHLWYVSFPRYRSFRKSCIAN